MSPAITVAIVDDHPVVRDGLSFLLGEQPDLRVVGEGANSGEALQLVEAQRPDVLVLDLNLEGLLDPALVSGRLSSRCGDIANLLESAVASGYGMLPSLREAAGEKYADQAFCRTAWCRRGRF